MMEHFVLKKMREIIGFHNGDSILAPGKWFFLFKADWTLLDWNVILTLDD